MEFYPRFSSSGNGEFYFCQKQTKQPLLSRISISKIYPVQTQAVPCISTDCLRIKSKQFMLKIPQSVKNKGEIKESKHIVLKNILIKQSEGPALKISNCKDIDIHNVPGEIIKN
jgi:hypothetical protein